MRQAFLIALLLVVLSVCCRTLGAPTAASEILDKARTLVANREYQKAAAVLEEGLPASTADDRGEMVGLLRQAYQNLIKQAEASGNSREAAEYRDNLAILEQAPAKASANSVQADPAHAPPRSPALPAPTATEPRANAADSLRIPRSSASTDQLPFKEPSPLPEPAPLPALEGPAPPGPAVQSGHPATEEGRGSRQSGSARRGRNSRGRRCGRSSQSGRIISFPTRTEWPETSQFDAALELGFRTDPG